MIIAVALTENHLRSLVDTHFGRCDWYGIYNSVSKEISYLENPNRYMDEGAGCKSVDFLLNLHIELVVAGRFGSKVVDSLKKNNIQMAIPNEPQTFEQIIKLLKK
jgi:predicted Fe-Mo cluster-binding NifX family protein